MNIGFIEEECLTKTGFALTIGDEELVPFGEFDLTIDGEDFTFCRCICTFNMDQDTGCSDL